MKGINIQTFQNTPVIYLKQKNLHICSNMNISIKLPRATLIIFFIIVIGVHSIGLNNVPLKKSMERIEANQLGGRWNLNRIDAVKGLNYGDIDQSYFNGISFVIYKNFIFFEGKQYTSNDTKAQCFRNNYRLTAFYNQLHSRVSIENPMKTVKLEPYNQKLNLISQLANLIYKSNACNLKMQECMMHENFIINAFLMATKIELIKTSQNVWELKFLDQNQNQILNLIKEK